MCVCVGGGGVEIRGVGGKGKGNVYETCHDNLVLALAPIMS